MQTALSARYRDTLQGKEADAILRSCVHCGFCTATCPTYQLLGDELDSPRGRIYLIKQVLEGEPVTEQTQTHLDRCLTCRSCETTCPSGVKYGRLVEIGRELVEHEVPRGLLDRMQRLLLRAIIPYPKRFGFLLAMGRIARPFLPAHLQRKIPAHQSRRGVPRRNHKRKVLMLDGCAQVAATPNTNDAAMRVLDKLGIETLPTPQTGCCGAMSLHMSAHDEALVFMRRNIDAWWQHIEHGAEAIVINASGCGAVIKDYGVLLQHDADYAAKAARVSALAKDLCEVLRDESLPVRVTSRKISFQSPCTLQHGQKLNGVVEGILTRLGFELAPVADAHLCCGSAGTYSLLQPALSQQLQTNKLQALERHAPECIVTANVGCQLHLASGASRPVRHWIELLDEALV